MRKVLVFDVAASTRGALTILNSFYEQAHREKDINWVFVLSARHIEEAKNVTVRDYAWVKKSRLHRMFFDYFVAHNIVAQEKADVVLSLQNINIPFTKAKQVTYVHQSIPFSDISFSFKENRLEWFYQNIVGKFIYKSIKRSSLVAVQTKWMKEAIMQKTGISGSKVIVVPPDVNDGEAGSYVDNEESRKRFFYPSAYATYKNHKIIIDAVEDLIRQGIGNFEVIFTVDEKELPIADGLKGIVHCIGTIPFHDVKEYYKHSTVLFPSLLETYGLPLAEAANIGSRIIAADRPYAREVLEEYSNCVFFDPADAKELAALMLNNINNLDIYGSQGFTPGSERKREDNWARLVNSIKNL